MENKQEKLLQVGDVLYSRQYGSIGTKFIIDRVTNTQAISGKKKFRRNIGSNGYVKSIGEGSYSPSYYIENDELKEEYQRKKAITYLSSYNFSKLPTTVLLDVFNNLANQN